MSQRLRYSGARRIGKEEIARSGAEITVTCGARSVGLLHTDQIYKGDPLYFGKADQLIEKGMALSIDCPLLYLDADGNVRLEDLWLITADGCEPLNSCSAPFISI